MSHDQNIGYVVKDSHLNFIMTRCKRFEDCITLVPECLTIKKRFVWLSRKKIQRIIGQSDSQLIVNYVNKKIGVLKDIINLVKDIKYLLDHFIVCRLEYYNRNINRFGDRCAKMALL